MILGAKAVDRYGKRLGGELVLLGQTFKIVGLIEKSNELVDSAVVMPLPGAQTLFYRAGRGFRRLPDGGRSRTGNRSGAERSRRIIRTSKSPPPADMARSAQAMLAAQRVFFNGIEGTAVLVSLIVITIVMVMAVAERKKEIGTLKAIGAKGRTILGLIVGEAVTLSLVGGLLAIPLTLSRFTHNREYLNPTAVLTTLGLTVVIGAAAALWPAWRAQRVDPLESLRYE